MDDNSDVMIKFAKGDKVYVLDMNGNKLCKAVVQSGRLSRGLEEYIVAKENGEIESVCGICLKEV